MLFYGPCLITAVFSTEYLDSMYIGGLRSLPSETLRSFEIICVVFQAYYYGSITDKIKFIQLATCNVIKNSKHDNFIKVSDCSTRVYKSFAAHLTAYRLVLFLLAIQVDMYAREAGYMTHELRKKNIIVSIHVTVHGSMHIL